MAKSKQTKTFLIIAGFLILGLVAVLVYRATRLVKDLTPPKTAQKKTTSDTINATNHYHPSIKIYGTKPNAPRLSKRKKQPKERPWVGKDPHLPSHEELMRRVRQQHIYPKNLPKVPKPGSPHYRISRSSFKAWLNKPLAENGARFVPNYNGNSPDGMRVTVVEPGSFYERLGLYKGDILLKVNGRQILSPGHALKYYKRVASRYRNLVLTFKRGGKSHTVAFDLLDSPQK